MLRFITIFLIKILLRISCSSVRYLKESPLYPVVNQFNPISSISYKASCSITFPSKLFPSQLDFFHNTSLQMNLLCIIFESSWFTYLLTYLLTY